jgi:hypothetical protein
MRKVLRHCGYVKESHYRQAWSGSEGQNYDAVGYAILRSDWESGRTTIPAFADELDRPSWPPWWGLCPPKESGEGVGHVEPVVRAVRYHVSGDGVVMEAERHAAVVALYVVRDRIGVEVDGGGPIVAMRDTGDVVVMKLNGCLTDVPVDVVRDRIGVEVDRRSAVVAECHPGHGVLVEVDRRLSVVADHVTAYRVDVEV